MLIVRRRPLDTKIRWVCMYMENIIDKLCISLYNIGKQEYQRNLAHAFSHLLNIVIVV